MEELHGFKKMASDSGSFISAPLNGEWMCAAAHLRPVGCSEHVPSALERMRGVVGDAVLGHVGVLRFVLRCAQRRHTVLVEGLHTRHCRH